MSKFVNLEQIKVLANKVKSEDAALGTKLETVTTKVDNLVAAGGDQVIDLGGDRFQLSTQGGVFGLDLVGKHLDLFEIYEFGHIFVLLKKYSISGMPPELSIKIPPLQATVLWDCGAAYLPSSAPNTSFSAPVVSSVLAASTDSLPSLSTVRPSPTFTPPRRKGVAVGRV